MVNLQYNNQLASDHAKLASRILISRINTILSNGGFKRGKRRDVDVVLSVELRRFFNLLTDETILQRFLMSKPNKIRQYINDILNTYPSFCTSGNDNYRILYNVFVDHGYENSQFSKKNFIDNLSISTCPYCNRCYIVTLSKSKKIKPEIDHFYPKHIYPFLGLSYYNLIPSCQTCNGYGGKHKDDTYANGLVNPYEISNDDFLFSYKLTLEKKNPLLNSSVEVYLPKKIQINSDTFKLEDLYKKHNDHVIELIIKSKFKYSKKYIKYLLMFKNLNLSQEEIDRMILGNYSKENQLHKRPLTKLYQDIGKELGLISDKSS